VAAENFLNDSLDLFKMRRCDFDLNPDPSFPGCIYSEMKMCLAPCFKGCSDAEYATEVERVRGFFDSGGQSLVRELAAQRDQASAGLEFETAAALHTRVEKVLAVVRVPEIVRRLDLLSGVIVQPSSEKDSVALFPFQQGLFAGAIKFPVQQQKDSRPQSMESRLEEALATAAQPERLGRAASELMENIALLKRWYYRSAKVGEIFLAHDKDELPLRRLVRGVSRVLRGERADADPMSTAAREYWLARTRSPGPGE
jgi:excinuclease UvrABC nuclease subunit